ncbi:hypothetical protein ACJRO7_026619 [Eucalyptus globulus]|uniref:AAA+ ATPase domain-containing protein n=1 Tax=Eucalyptus globulus TaxID=34317 RepID=A0ABD3JQ04_EUCGL
MADIGVPVAVEVAKCLVAPVGRHCSYVIFCDRYVRQLNGEVEKLGDTRDQVQHSIDEAGNNMKPIKPMVARWVNEVEAVANEVRDVLDYDEKAKKTCFYGWLPNPKARYHLGKKASRTVKVIQALIAGGQFEKVDFENPPPGLVGGASDVNSSAGDGGDFITDSRASVFQGIMKALNDEKVKVVGVYGPGGVGKTTLMEEVEKKLRNEKILFHMIAKTKVLQNPNLKNIQDDIAYFLSLDLNDEKSLVGRADRLSKKLQSDPTKKILIILDDLWDKLDLKAVGIPLGNESRGCKLLLTSRYKDVLLRQNMRASPIFHLKGLEDDEAFSLFEKTVGNRLKDDEELKVIAPQVVKKLAGLPLLINSVANTLKDSDVYAWRNALIKIDEKEKDTIVKLSYDHLKSEDAKSLFLLCGLIGGTIRVETLLILGMGLGLFEEFRRTMQDARDRLNTTLDKLRSACLLLDDGDDNENVTIHDLYSEVIISTPFRGQNSLMMNSNYGSWPKEKLEKCWAICIVDVGKDRLVELKTCRFPDLKILMLSQPENWRWMREHQHEVEGCSGLLDFTYIKKLQVLYFRSMHITTLPSSIEILKNLQSLYLDHCDVEDVAILGNLEALQFLSFAGSKIQRLPKEIGKLTNLKLLNLSDCYMLQIIEPDVLKALTNLEELHMKGSFDEWMGKDEILSGSYNVRLAELESLKKLSALEISISNPTILLEVGDLPFGNLKRFWINIGNVNGREFEGLRTMKLKLEGCNGILSKEWVQKALQKTQHLHLDGLREVEKDTHELCIQGFLQLKHLDIQNSPSVKCIASSSNRAFTILESLFLKNLIILEKICHGDIAAECFSKLKAVMVKKCNRLKYLWRLSQMQKLVQLEEIEVRECDSMRAIATIDSRKDIFHADYGVELSNVRRLYLANLPDMMSFCTGAKTTSEGAPIQVTSFSPRVSLS